MHRNAVSRVFGRGCGSGRAGPCDTIPFACTNRAGTLNPDHEMRRKTVVVARLQPIGKTSGPEATSRGVRMLRTALGAAIAASLEEPGIVEIVLNPERIWRDFALSI